MPIFVGAGTSSFMKGGDGVGVFRFDVLDQVDGDE